MRPYPLLLAAVCSAAACSRDLTSSSSSSTSGTATSSSGLNISVDSTFINRTGVVATPIPALVHVTLAGLPEAGVTVTWVSPDGGSVSPASSMTDASGVAASTWTLGDTARAYTLTAAITGASVTMQATGTAAAVASLSKITQDSLVAAGASTLLTVRAVDQFGNPVAGVAVSWTTTGGALTAATTTTGTSGNADVVFSSDGTPRSYTVTATTAGLPAVTFTVIGQ